MKSADMITSGGKFGTKRVDDLLQNIESGLTRERACMLVGITGRTLRSWLKEGREDIEQELNTEKAALVERLDRAEVAFEKVHLENIALASAKRWEASAWLLERKWPESYGRRFTVSPPSEESDSIRVIG